LMSIFNIQNGCRWPVWKKILFIWNGE
jgi:hypothetical protein